MVIFAGCGGGGSDSSGISGSTNSSTPVTPDVSVTPGTTDTPVTPDAPSTPDMPSPEAPGLISWLFVNSNDYTYDAGKVRISDGTAGLILVDQTDDDNALTGFGGGTYNLTQWDEENALAELQADQTSGYFTSRIIDAGASTSWSALSWTPQMPYGKELPDDNKSESGYSEGNADMTGNVLLMHMNEAGGTINDYSGNGNDGIVENDVSYSAEGIFNTALNFSWGRVYIASLNPASTSDITITAWFKTVSGGTIAALGGTSYPGLGVSDGYVTANNTQGGILAGGATVVNDGKWHFAAAVMGSSGLKIYVDGILDAPAGASSDSSGNNYAKIGLGTGFHWGSFGGTIDEVAVFNRALTGTEILDFYKRGAMSLKFQIRSCDDPLCDNEQFTGPDATAGSFYSELNNTAINPPSLSLANVPDNRYFQYRAYFGSDNISYSPGLKKVMIGPAHYPGDNATIVNKAGQKYLFLNSFFEIAGGGSAGAVRYQISANGTRWYYHNGTNWETAEGYSETNSAMEVNLNLWTFHSQIGTGTFYFKAFFHSDTIRQVELNRVYLGYTN